MTRALRDARVMIVGDQRANVSLLGRMLEARDVREVVGLCDSRWAVELFSGFEPDVVLLDLRMPAPDGFDCLSSLRQMGGRSSHVPIPVLTADETRRARRRALALGANDFLTKPFDPVEVRLRITNLLQARRLHRRLERGVEARTGELEQSHVEMLERLAVVTEFRDGTQEHAERIGRTAILLAERLGMPYDDRMRVGRAAALHDIGKIAIPDALLLKAGPLTDTEFETIKEHTMIGARILARSTSALMRMAEETARTHHERWDGKGYPCGLRGEQIPLVGRIVAVADVFDALTHDRPYKRAWTVESAVDEIFAQRGHHFDPRVVDAFMELDHASMTGRHTRRADSLSPSP